MSQPDLNEIVDEIEESLEYTQEYYDDEDFLDDVNCHLEIDDDEDDDYIY